MQDLFPHKPPVAREIDTHERGSGVTTSAPLKSWFHHLRQDLTRGGTHLQNWSYLGWNNNATERELKHPKYISRRITASVQNLVSICDLLDQTPLVKKGRPVRANENTRRTQHRPAIIQHEQRGDQAQLTQWPRRLGPPIIHYNQEARGECPRTLGDENRGGQSLGSKEVIYT